MKSAGPVEILFPTINRVSFTVAVENDGNVTQTTLRVADDLAAFVTPATLLSASYPVATTVAGFGAGTANAGFDGVSDTELLAGAATLALGDTGTITITLSYTGAPANPNVAAARSDQLTAAVGSNPVTVTQTDSDGDGVPDEIVGTGDRDGGGIANAQDYDPTGTFYCEDDGRILSGGADSVVRVGGGGAPGAINIVRDGSTGLYQFFVAETGTYRLLITYPPGMAASPTRVSAGTLDLAPAIPNVISIGSSEAGATGRLATFAAGANPWYDAFVIEAGAPFIINNNIPVAACLAPGSSVVATKVADRDAAVFVDKDGKVALPEEEAAQKPAEPGIPGVRIATVNGLLTTTDEFGRYHVPCASLPADIGSNFTLKLDGRTLPSGYALTTENPRTLHLTPGKVAKMNFGVALTDMVDVGLTAQALSRGRRRPGLH